MSIQPRKIASQLGLLLMALLTGCSTTPYPGVYAIYSRVRGEKSPVQVVENGHPKTLYQANADWTVYSVLWPFTPFEGGMMSDHLFDLPVRNGDSWKGAEMYYMPRERSVETIVELARYVAPLAPPHARYPDRANVRWILGITPLIVAVGDEQVVTDDNLPSLSERSYKLVHADDLSATAEQLIVLDHWPTPWKYTGSAFEEKFIAELAPKTRTIELRPGTTLRQIFKARQWEEH